MSGGNGLHTRHQYQGGEMKDDKDDAQLCGQWHRVCELAALPEQAGRSAWLEGRVLALFRLGEHVYALDGVDPLAGVAVLGRGLV
ncbi:nitrite reductase (NAD(P)H) small subunit, partial [Aeromonas caviae]|uniref:nitrite reductase (NAD(P)H) small subunit n=1 Tax=Aeromonas caviae TaxID=648 RepID=UPI0025B70B3A